MDIVSIEKTGLCREVWINREDSLNAINYDVLRGLMNALKELRQTVGAPGGYKECRAVFLRGRGRAFVAGADIKVMYECTWEEVAQFIRLGQRVMREIQALPLPVVAVVDGFALGGGLELALSCDLILATERAELGTPETGLGIIPGFGGTQTLAHRVGIGSAKRIIYTGESIKGKDAYTQGIADYFVESSALDEKLAQITERLVNKGPLGIAAAKKAIWKGHEHHTLAGMTKELDEFLEAFNTEDAKEGLAAFVEKRKPEFKGI